MLLKCYDRYHIIRIKGVVIRMSDRNILLCAPVSLFGKIIKIFQAVLVLYFCLRKNNNSVSMISKKLMPVVASTFPKKNNIEPNCNHSRNTR